VLTLIYSKSTNKTGRALANLLGLKACKYPNPTDVVVIRWGSSVGVCQDLAINTPQSISLASHSIRSLKALAGAGIPTPPIYYDIPKEPECYPILGRKIHHRAGVDIKWCNDQAQASAANRPYFTGYVPVDQEYRVHVFNGEPIRTFVKVQRFEDAHQRIRTSKFGWGYSIVRRGQPHDIWKIAVGAVEALGLTFGGVDIAKNRGTGQIVVFEVNTGPSLNTITQLLYADLFEKYLINLGVGYVPSGHNWTEEYNNRIESNRQEGD